MSVIKHIQEIQQYFIHDDKYMPSTPISIIS